MPPLLVSCAAWTVGMAAAMLVLGVLADAPSGTSLGGGAVPPDAPPPMLAVPEGGARVLSHASPPRRLGGRHVLVGVCGTSLVAGSWALAGPVGALGMISLFLAVAFALDGRLKRAVPTGSVTLRCAFRRAAIVDRAGRSVFFRPPARILAASRRGASLRVRLRASRADGTEEELDLEGAPTVLSEALRALRITTDFIDDRPFDVPPLLHDHDLSSFLAAVVDASVGSFEDYRLAYRSPSYPNELLRKFATDTRLSTEQRVAAFLTLDGRGDPMECPTDSPHFSAARHARRTCGRG